MNSVEEAKQLKQRGYHFIPLLKNEKKNHDKDILTKEYSLEDVKPDNNLGINLKKSNLIDIDLDDDWAIKFGELWLPKNTLILGRTYPDRNIEKTHYFFKNENKTGANTTVAQFRVDGQTVVYGKTKHKITGEYFDRKWINSEDPSKCENIKDIFHKICFASVIAPYVNKRFQLDNVALKIDSCIYRYTNWTEDERIKFLKDFYKTVSPKEEFKKIKDKEFTRTIEYQEKAKKNGGYKALANTFKLKWSETKEWCNLIGKVPEEKEKTKSIIDFNSERLDMKSLMTEDIPPLKFAVPKILPEGLVCIAGRPKAYKSWTSLMIAYSVQNALELWGSKCEKGDVLYLALEDSKRRMKSRIKKLGFEDMIAPTINLEAPYLGFGLEESIQQWIDNSENPKLVVLDTLARVKPKTKRTSGTVYDLDNELLRKIQKLAMENGITIAFITHLSKAAQDYNFDKITGSVGLQGMTDAMWLLDRGDNQPDASLIGRGRDIEDFEYTLIWDQETWRYNYKGIKWEIELSENRKIILDHMKQFLDQEKKEVYPKDIYKNMGFKATQKEAKNISKTLARMVRDGTIRGGKIYGTYALNEAYPEDLNIV